MTETIKETVVTQSLDGVVTDGVQVRDMATQSQSTAYLIYFLFGVVDILLVCRLVLKILGASTAGAFVRAIYGVSGFLIWPFEGIFRRGVSQGIETVSVFEPATFIAMIMYGVLAWGVVVLVRVLSGERQVG